MTEGECHEAVLATLREFMAGRVDAATPGDAADPATYYLLDDGDLLLLGGAITDLIRAHWPLTADKEG